MKKIFLFLIAVLMVVVSASGIAACSNGAGKRRPKTRRKRPAFPIIQAAKRQIFPMIRVC